MIGLRLGLLAVTLLLFSGCGKDSATSGKHPWASFKVGSYVKTRMSTAMNLGGRPVNTTGEIKQTLVELTAANAVIEIETTVMGKSTSTRRDLPLSATSPLTDASAGAGTPMAMPAGTAAKVLNKGTETITVAGKSVSCEWTETAVAQSANTGTVKIYKSEKIPGGVVKMITKITGGMNSESTMEVIEFLAK